MHESLPQYSGGLGILAGDHIKSVSDLGVPLIGVGLLYRNGFYTQEFRADGSTRVIYPQVDFADEPIHDTGKIISVPMGRGRIKAKIWREDVGRTSLYLLDCDIPQNKPEDRQLTRHLYGGNREYRIRQEILLGIGGLIALDAMNIKPTVIHMNEGHAAFAALERMARLRKRGVALRDAEMQVAQRMFLRRTHPFRRGTTASCRSSHSNTSDITPNRWASASRNCLAWAARIRSTPMKNSA